MALTTIAADKHYLKNPKGHPFFVCGVNYTGYFDRAWKMWEADRYDSTLIARDFRKAQHSGFNTIRLFIHWALIQDIRKNNFTKLDETLSLAQDHDLLVMITLNDAHLLDMTQVSEIDAKIAARYKEVPTVFAYDLENEPVFYNLAAATYSKDSPPPIQSSRLVDHYGEKVKRGAVADLQRQRRIPPHLDQEAAYYYINALHLFLDYDAAINAFVNQGKGTLVDFMLSAEAEPWYTLIEVLDGTVETWLRARIDPIRAAGCPQLLTVGWNWLHFAGLPANRLLDLQQYHNYTPLSLGGFNTNVRHLESLQRAFPKHPIIFGEFGWSNQSSREPGSSRSIHPELTALYEAATLAYLRANGFAGGMKWMLNDVTQVSNPYEASFGVFQGGDVPKPIRALIQRFDQTWPPVDEALGFKLLREVEAGFSYRLDSPGQVTVGGYLYQDDALSWRGNGIAHCFIRQENQELFIESHGAGRLSIDPWDLISDWDRAHEADVYLVYGQSLRSRQLRFGAGQSVVIDVRPGTQYAVSMGARAPAQPPPEGTPVIDPQPGEHVLLLGDFEKYLQSALTYIRRFAPDFTFAADEVAGRWAYVSVIAPPDQIPDVILENIRGTGAVLVERVVADTPAETEAMLNELAQRGQRFLSVFAPIPPQEEPPVDMDEPVSSPDGPVETYVVQPGDSLGKIARHVYGDVRLWPLIFEANKDKISDPGLIRVGMTLNIPEQA